MKLVMKNEKQECPVCQEPASSNDSPTDAISSIPPPKKKGCRWIALLWIQTSHQQERQLLQNLLRIFCHNGKDQHIIMD